MFLNYVKLFSNIYSSHGEVFIICKISYSLESEVFLPDISLRWELAKTQVEFISNTACQNTYHLGGTQFVFPVFCLAYRRHFSSQHPLYDFFKHHCEGTTPHIALSFEFLAAANSSGDLHSALGTTGIIQLASQEFNKRYYGHYDFEQLVDVG